MTNHNHDRSSAWLIIIMIDLFMANQIKSSLFMNSPETKTSRDVIKCVVKANRFCALVLLHVAIDARSITFWSDFCDMYMYMLLRVAYSVHVEYL